eukprot:CAMPEP_0204864656 /NCGR_PEP_ID=MMETSP1348-20121228/4206_1 /ASSEMBLY_ACC=CAM_ASM_000700 /TAXON_ID=215587 /ORGANISM="Aplanochytrium stocchinoi, Strain GSBS06" /LENGTH=800 /DNA_ID=CAMNT_0052015337 /DNA_START=444 /DNA_END=2846 /DNA_ORIENTATION=+
MVAEKDLSNRDVDPGDGSNVEGSTTSLTLPASKDAHNKIKLIPKAGKGGMKEKKKQNNGSNVKKGAKGGGAERKNSNVIVDNWEIGKKGKDKFRMEKWSEYIMDEEEARNLARHLDRIPPRIFTKQGGIQNLAEAIEVNNADGVALALARGENPNGTLHLPNGAFTSITYLHYSCWHGFKEIVGHLLSCKDDIDVNCQTADTGFTPLHFAVMNGHAHIAEELLNHGADANVEGYKNRETPLEAAMSLHGTEIVDLLVKGGADITHLNHQGFPMLHLAYICHGHQLDPLARHVLNKYKDRIDINQKTRIGHTLLDHVTRFGDISTMEELIENGAVGGDRPNNPLLFLASQIYSDNNSKDCLAAFSLAMKAKPDVGFIEPTRGLNALHCLAGIEASGQSTYNHVALAKSLVEAGIRINSTTAAGETALLLACQVGNVELVKHLKRLGADISVCNNKGYSPLHAAARFGRTEMVEYLIDSGFDPNMYDESSAHCTPLVWACGKGHLETAQLLKEKGADIVMGCKRSKFTALHAAARENHLDVVIFLLKSAVEKFPPPLSGRNLNRNKAKSNSKGFNKHNYRITRQALKSFYQEHAPSKASEENLDKIMKKAGGEAGGPQHRVLQSKLLKKYGVAPKLETRNGDSEKATTTNHKKKYADGFYEFINSKERANYLTPVHYAAQFGHKAICKCLLDYECDVTVTDKNGYTPAEYADCGNFKELRRILSGPNVYRTKLIEPPERSSRNTILPPSSTSRQFTEASSEKRKEIKSKNFDSVTEQTIINHLETAGYFGDNSGQVTTLTPA